MTVPLDERKTPQQNAAYNYKMYTKAKTANRMLTALIAGLVQTCVLDALSLGYLQTLVFAAIVLIVVYAMNAVAKAAFKKDLGVYFPVIALNSAVLGLAVNNAADALSLGESILTALGAGGRVYVCWIVSQNVNPSSDPRIGGRGFYWFRFGLSVRPRI